MCRFEPTFDKVIHIDKDIPVSVLMERIKERNRIDENIN